MSFSRYRNLNVLSGKFYETSTFPSKDKLDSVSTFQIRVANFDRLDNLAFKHLGSGEYWWVIALLNNIDWAYKFEEGQVLRIPVDVQDVLRLF